MPADASFVAKRASLNSANALKIGLFGANCSSGRAVTNLPERWSGSWADCKRLAHQSDRVLEAKFSNRVMGLPLKPLRSFRDFLFADFRSLYVYVFVL